MQQNESVQVYDFRSLIGGSSENVAFLLLHTISTNFQVQSKIKL